MPGCSLPSGPIHTAGGPGVITSATPRKPSVPAETTSSPKFPENPDVPAPCSLTPASPACQAIRQVGAAPRALYYGGAPREVISGLNRKASALAVYASQDGSLHTTQDSLPAAGQALPGGIKYPQGSNERFQIGSIHLVPLSRAFLAQRMSPFVARLFSFTVSFVLIGHKSLV